VHSCLRMVKFVNMNEDNIEYFNKKKE